MIYGANGKVGAGNTPRASFGNNITSKVASGGVNGLSSAMKDTYTGIAATEGEMTASALGSGNALGGLFKMFQQKSIIGMLSDFFSGRIQNQKSNLALSKGTQPLAKAANKS